MNNTGNPEALHLVGQSTKNPMSKSFVNPGTPAAPLVRYDQLSSARIAGAKNDTLRASITK